MKEQKRLLITISGVPTYHGTMHLDFVMTHFGEKHPENETEITVFELCDDASIKKVYERKDGEWTDINE